MVSRIPLLHLVHSTDIVIVFAQKYRDILSVEFEHVRIHANAFGMQAAVDRAYNETHSDSSASGRPAAFVDPTDYEFVQEVIEGSCQIMQTAIRLAEKQQLCFAPVRVFLRIVTAGVYLLKGIGLGVSTSDLENSLKLLDRTITELKRNALDDLHLASRYSQLLEAHVLDLRKSFVATSRPLGLGTRTPNIFPDTDAVVEVQPGALADRIQDAAVSCPLPAGSLMSSEDDWLALPFDPSIAPFSLDSSQPFSVFDDGTLNFLWNLSAG